MAGPVDGSPKHLCAYAAVRARERRLFEFWLFVNTHWSEADVSVKKNKLLTRAFDEINRTTALLKEIESCVECAATSGNVPLNSLIDKTVALKEAREK